MIPTSSGCCRLPVRRWRRDGAVRRPDTLDVTHTAPAVRGGPCHGWPDRYVRRRRAFGSDSPAGRLLDAFDGPRHRVVVGDESEPFIREGRNAVAKFVQSADSALRPGDEALVVHEDGYLLAVGRAELPGSGMDDVETGMAVKVRQGAEDCDGVAS